MEWKTSSAAAMNERRCQRVPSSVTEFEASTVRHIGAVQLALDR